MNMTEQSVMLSFYASGENSIRKTKTAVSNYCERKERGFSFFSSPHFVARSFRKASLSDNVALRVTIVGLSSLQIEFHQTCN